MIIGSLDIDFQPLFLSMTLNEKEVRQQQRRIWRGQQLEILRNYRRRFVIFNETG